jgi:hypothetical protein
MKKLILTAAFAVLAPAAFAQDSAAPAQPAGAMPTVAATETIAPPSCTKPELQRDPKTGKLLHVKELNKASAAYQDCINAYVEVQKANAKAHYDAGDAAVHDLNEFAHQMNAAAAEAEAKMKKQEEDQKQ